MRRTIFMLAAAMLAALPPVVAGAGNGAPGTSAAGQPGADPIAAFGAQLVAGSTGRQRNYLDARVFPTGAVRGEAWA